MSKPAPEIEALAESLRNLVGCDDTERNREPRRGFWLREPQRKMRPRATDSPNDYDGSGYLNLVPSQAGLPARQQKALVEEWCRFLPTVSNLEWLWFSSSTSQELFDAACRVPHLKALYVERGRIHDLSSLRESGELEYLHIGGSPGIRSIEPLGKLAQLKWLELDDAKAVTRLEPLHTLVNLDGLAFTGSEFKRNAVESFFPLADLTQLRWLNVAAIRTKDQSLRAFSGMKNLEYLGIANHFPMEEFAWLSTRLPSSICDWLEPYSRHHSSVFPCPTCKQNWRVSTSGKGNGLLCPTCDSLKLAHHISKFNAQKTLAQRDLLAHVR
jgi:hypothetical protein